MLSTVMTPPLATLLAMIPLGKVAALSRIFKVLQSAKAHALLYEALLNEPIKTLRRHTVAIYMVTYLRQPLLSSRLSLVVRSVTAVRGCRVTGPPKMDLLNASTAWQ